MGKKVYVEGTVRWARLMESNRDMGENVTNEDVKAKLKAIDGQYTLDLYDFDEKEMVKKGIPNKGLMGQLFKTNQEGEKFYKCKRPHMNPNFEDPYMGPPKVLKQVGEELVEWDWENDGLIGNGSRVVVKFDVWQGKIVTMEAVKVLEHVPYESTNEGGF